MRKCTGDTNGAIGLPREDWDFGSCPAGRELYCWQYEYARESEAIVAQYRHDKEHPCEGYKVDPSFDANGNWSYRIDILDSDGDLDEQISLELAPGFPDVPYLKTEHVPWHWDGEPFDFEDLFGPDVDDAGAVKNRKPPPAPKYFAELYIRWESADKKLLRSFARWLKKRRPFPPRTSRGKSASKGNMADLKALGAYRLMKIMTVEAAMTYTAKARGGHPLFSKRPDWSKARRRAKAIIDRYFERG